jgi:Flp pilus assembly protein TadG
MNRIQAMTRLRVFHPRLRDRNSSLGQSVVEFAMIVPVALVVLGGALDMGRLFYTSVSIENAAREGAFYGASDPRCDTSAQTLCDDPNTADWRVRNEVAGLSGLNVTFTCSSGGTPVSVTSCQAGDVYETRVTTTFDLITPLLMPIFGTTMDLEASASAVVLNDAFDPNASPQPMPSVPPLCTVQDFVGMKTNEAKNAWKTAGFDQALFDAPGMGPQDIVATQSIPAWWTEPCADTSITVGM